MVPSLPSERGNDPPVQTTHTECEEEMPVYLELFHGRSVPEENLQDWGDPGPILGPLRYFHTTYAADLKLETVDGQCGELSLVGSGHDLIYYDGKFYGDWSVFSSEDLNEEGRERIAQFERSKSILSESTAKAKHADSI